MTLKMGRSHSIIYLYISNTIVLLNNLNNIVSVAIWFSNCDALYPLPLDAYKSILFNGAGSPMFWWVNNMVYVCPCWSLWGLWSKWFILTHLWHWLYNSAIYILHILTIHLCKKKKMIGSPINSIQSYYQAEVSSI